MEKKEKESYMTQAYNKLRGRLVRGLSRSNATMCLIDILTSKELIAITDRQANTISRLKTRKARPTIDDAEELYNFYKLVSESGLPIENDNDGQEIEDYPLYTQSDTNVMLNKIQAAQEQVDLTLKQLTRELATHQRTVIDFAPKYPLDIKELADGSVSITSSDPDDDNQPIILGKPVISNLNNEKLAGNKKNTSNKEQPVKDDIKLKKEEQREISISNGEDKVKTVVQRNNEKKKGVPEGVRPLRLFRSKNRAGETVWSTEGKTWYLAPKNGETYLKQAIGYVGKYAPIYNYLTMRQRYLLEFTTLMHEKAYRKEIPQNELEAYRKLFTDPESYWMLFFKYAQHDMVNLREEYGENVKMLEPHFATVDEVIEWEHSLDQYLKNNPKCFSNMEILDHSPQKVGM